MYAIIFSTLLEMAAAADPNTPHPHQGIITKFFDPGRAELTPAEQAALLSGQAVYKQTRHDNVNRGTAIFDVAASQEQPNRKNRIAISTIQKRGMPTPQRLSLL